MTSTVQGDWLSRLVQVQPHERPALLWAFVYFFCLLCSYYIIRPIRDTLGISAGIENLQVLYLMTIAAMLLLVPLFGWLTSRWPRRLFLPFVYLFFISNLLLFYVAFETLGDHRLLAQGFYLWVNVFNLFVVSVFWSYMTDVFDDEQAKRLFGFIAAGGSAGAIAGPLITSSLIEVLGQQQLFLVSAGFLGVAIACISKVRAADQAMETDRPAFESGSNSVADKEATLGGGVWAGIALVLRSPYLLGIAVLMLCYSVISTFLYFQQVGIIAASFSDDASRTVMFARVDLAVNVLTIFCQLFLTGRLIKTLGLGMTLAIIPVVLVFGLLMLGFATSLGIPLLAVIIGLQIVRRAGYYAIINPAREALYVVLSREEKYKAKNFIDTSVYRGGDALAAGLSGLLRSAGIGVAQVALLTVPIAALWLAVSLWLGKRHDQAAQSGLS